MFDDYAFILLESFGIFVYTFTSFALLMSCVLFAIFFSESKVSIGSNFVIISFSAVYQDITN